MRLTELTSPSQNKTVLKEDTEVKSSPTILISPAEIYQMSGQIPPSIEGPNGTMIQPEGWYDRVEMEVGTEEGMVTPAYAQAHNEWVNGGRVPGLLWDSETNTMKPYNENGALEDLGWAIAAGAFETASAMTKGGAKVLDDTLSLVTYVGTAGNVNTFGNNKILKKTMASSTVNDKGERVYDEFMLDDAANWFTNNTDQAFQDNVELTSSAVNSFGDVAGLFLGGVPGGWEGALGIMASELPSEILDLGLMMVPGGLAAGGVLNAFEAGGAAASEIQKTIDAAYDRGALQETPQYQVMLNAATQQIIKDNPDMSPADVAESASILAREQLTHGAINRGFYAVAAIGGVADTIQNKVAYGGPIRKKFLGNALGKAIISPASEAIGEMGEQLVTNMAIRNKAGKIVQAEEGVINAGWNGWIAGNTATMVGTGASVIGKGNQAQRAARARLRQFFAGGSNDPEALVDVASMDANTLRTYVTDDSGKLRLGELVRERSGLVTMEDLTPDQQRQVNRRRSKGVVIDGKRYTKRQLEENSRDLELIDKFNNIDIDPRENKAVVIVDSEEDIRRIASLLGLESKGKINKVMANLEEVRKLDFRIQGRSNLEAPVWSDLNRRQRQEYIKNGSVTFVGDKERGNQTWTRDQIMFNSRRNQDDVPDDIANLLDNTDARPTMDPDDQREIDSQQALIDNSIAMTAARRELEADQKEWDAAASANGEAAATADLGPRPSEDMEGDPYNFTGARASTSMSQRTIDQIKKNLANAQTDWDTQYGDTHNPNGVVIYSKPSSAVTNFVRRAFIAKPKTSGVDTVDTTAPTQPTDDSEVDTTAPAQPTDDSAVDTTPASGLDSPQGADDAVDVDTDTSPITQDDLIGDDKKKIVAPVVLTPGETTSKAHVTYLHKIAIANGDMDPISVAAMLKKSEESFPGITDDVLPGGIDSYVQDPRTVKKTLQNDSKTQTAPTDVTRNGKPPKGTNVELNGQDYTFAGAMWVPIKPDGSRGSTGHKNHKELMKKWQDSTIDQTIPDQLKTPDMDSADNIDTTAPDAPANTDASIKKAQDQVTPDLTPEPATTDPVQQGGRGTPPTAAQSAERAAMRKDTAQAAANARIAQQKADKIKADAQAKADAQNTASDAKLIARGKRIADQQADAKVDAQNTASDAKLIARGKEIADQQAATKADAQNTASDAKLIALAKAFSDASKDAKTSKQDQASDDKLIALAKAQADADRDAAIQAKKQADLDAQQKAKDAQAQRDAEQAQRDAEQQQQQQQQDQQQQQQQQDQQQQQQQDQQQQQQQQDLTPVVLPKLTKKQQKTQAQSKIMTKKQVAKNANKAIRSPRGVDKPAQKRNLKLNPFTPLTMPDPMNLSRYKSFGENINGKNNMKNLQEGYKIMPPMDPKYTERSGLEGPFTMLSGKVVYYDPKEGSYYDPDTDMYMSYDEFQNHDKDYSGMKDERNEVKEHENEYTASDIMSDDLPVGIDFDTSNLPKVNWDMHSVEEIKLFVNNLENLDFEDGLDVNDNGYDGSSGEAAKWVEKNVLSRRSDEVGETLSPEDKALVNKMYNKDGTLTDLGKRVMGTKESRTLENLMSKVFDNALSEFEFNPRAGHRDQPSHPENRGLTPEYPEINVRPKARPTSSAPKTSMRPKLRPANLQMRNDINKAVQQAMGEGDGRKKGIHPKGHPMRSKQQAAIHANEGKMSDSIIVDSETMSKEEFAKKYGTEMANEYYESIAAQNVLDNSILAKENVDKLRKIVSDKSMMPIKFNDGTMNVDMTTANIFVKAFDKMKETNQAKVSEMIKTKAGFLRVMDIIYGAMK